MTSSPHGLYGQGDTRATMGGTKGRETARWSQSWKAARSPDRSLQLDSVKSESLVIVDQPCHGEYVSRALYTPPVTPWELAAPEGGS